MTDLATTGPALLDLRWGQNTDERADGRIARDLYPHTQHQEADGYLHPGIAAAAVIGALDKTVGAPAEIGSVAIGFEAPVPLGMDLRAVVDQAAGDGGRAVTFEVIDRSDREHQPVHALGRGTIGEVRRSPRSRGAHPAGRRRCG